MLIDKEVKFHEYCYKCKYADMAEDSWPCDECLESPVNQYSHKPVRFRENETSGSSEKSSQ